MGQGWLGQSNLCTYSKELEKLESPFPDSNHPAFARLTLGRNMAGAAALVGTKHQEEVGQGSRRKVCIGSVKYAASVGGRGLRTDRMDGHLGGQHQQAGTCSTQ